MRVTLILFYNYAGTIWYMAVLQVCSLITNYDSIAFPLLPDPLSPKNGIPSIVLSAFRC